MYIIAPKTTTTANKTNKQTNKQTNNKSKKPYSRHSIPHPSSLSMSVCVRPFYFFFLLLAFFIFHPQTQGDIGRGRLDD
jgi:ATP-dependent Zn protease